MRKAENTGLFLHEKPEFEALQDAMAARGTGAAREVQTLVQKVQSKNNMKENNVLHSTTTIPFNHYHPPPPTNNVSGR